MPSENPNPSAGPDLTLPSAQAALLTDALASVDAMIVSQALHRIAKAQEQSYSFGDDPALSIILAAIETLGLDLRAEPVA